MTVTVLRKTKYLNSWIYVLQFEYVFQYMFSFNTEIYQDRISFIPGLLARLLWRVGVIKTPFTDEQIEEGEKIVLSGALKTLFAVAEAYPQLRAAENFVELQRELSDTENKIQAARRFYNSNVVALNIALESFPSNIIGRTFGFGKMELFDLEEEAARKPVAVKF